MNKIYPDVPWFYQEEGFLTSAENVQVVELGIKNIPTQSKIGLSNPQLDSNIRTSNQSWIHYDPEVNWLFKKVSERVKLVNDNMFKFNIQTFESLQFASYEDKSNGKYSKHTDCGELSCMMRKLSVVIMLSDPTEFQGGDLLLYSNAVPVTIPKKQNKIVIFPSFVVHEVTPVTRGTRYSLTTWASGPQFI